MSEPTVSAYGTTPGRTFHADARPVRKAPRLRWSVATDAYQLYAATGRVAAVGNRLWLGDLATGKPLPRLKRLPRPGGGYSLLRGDTLLTTTEDSALVTLDLESGEATGPHAFGEMGAVEFLDGLVLWNSGSSVTAYAPGPKPKELWSFSEPKGDFNEVLDAGPLLLAQVRRGDTVALDRKTGKERWRSPTGAAMADAAGSVFYAPHGSDGFGVLDASGKQRWQRQERWAVRVLGPDYLVAEDSDVAADRNATVRVLDRATGKERCTLGEVGSTQLTCTAAGEVVYGVAAPGTLVAWEVGGAELWRFRIPRMTADVNYLLAVDGAVLGVTGSGRAFCVEGD